MPKKQVEAEQISCSLLDSLGYAYIPCTSIHQTKKPLRYEFASDLDQSAVYKYNLKPILFDRAAHTHNLKGISELRFNEHTWFFLFKKADVVRIHFLLDKKIWVEYVGPGWIGHQNHILITLAFIFFIIGRKLDMFGKLFSNYWFSLLIYCSYAGLVISSF